MVFLSRRNLCQNWTNSQLYFSQHNDFKFLSWSIWFESSLRYLGTDRCLHVGTTASTLAAKTSINWALIGKALATLHIILYSLRRCSSRPVSTSSCQVVRIELHLVRLYLHFIYFDFVLSSRQLKTIWCFRFRVKLTLPWYRPLLARRYKCFDSSC